jgi:GNAT superfamily N-acetyltransferase
VIVSRSDAHAQTTEQAATATESCDLTTLMHGGKRQHAQHGALSAHASPSLTRSASATPGASEANDCATVARYLSELETDTTHGADNRPDEAMCAQCAKHYENQCESERWSEARRNCTLAAGDLINAHLCAGTVTGSQTAEIPPHLACPVLSKHLASVAQGAGLYADVTDFPQQIEAACTMANWPLELRQFYILQAWQGSGAAQELMEWVIDEAVRRGADELYLSVFIDNHRARRFYERYGFEPVGRYAFMVGSHADEDEVMRRPL